MKTVIMMALLMLVITESAFARRMDQRQHRQQTRIQQGVASGELTRREAIRLERGQAHVNRIERRAERDGEVTAGEKLRIEKAQDRQSRRIFKQKHDGQERSE